MSLGELQRRAIQLVIAPLHQQPGFLADAREHIVRHERQGVARRRRGLDAVFLLEHAQRQAIRAHAFHLVVKRIVSVRRADEQLAPPWHQDVDLLAQPVAHLLARLGIGDVLWHFHVVVLNFIGAR